MLKWLIDIITRPSHEDRVIELITKRKIIRDELQSAQKRQAHLGYLLATKAKKKRKKQMIKAELKLLELQINKLYKDLARLERNTL